MKANSIKTTYKVSVDEDAREYATDGKFLTVSVIRSTQFGSNQSSLPLMSLEELKGLRNEIDLYIKSVESLLESMKDIKVQ